MGLKGNLTSLSKFSQDLRRLPKVVAQKVTTAAAPEITALSRATFEASENAYGVPWAPGTKGQKITLRKKGDLARYVHYVGIGTKLRVALGVAYAKYQIGKRPIFPGQGTSLPVAYVQTLQRVAADTVRAEMRGGT